MALFAAWLLVPCGASGQTAYSSGVVSLVNTDATFPAAIGMDSSGNIFVADMQGNTVFEIDGATGASRTLATGFNQPWGIAVDASGDVFVSDTNNHAIRKLVAVGGLVPDNPTIQTVASGIGFPYQLAFERNGNLLVALKGSVKELVAVGGVIPASPTINTLGSGFNFPAGVAIDSQGNVYVADYNAQTISEMVAVGGVIPASPTVRTLATNVGATGLALDAHGNLYFADFNNSVVGELVAVNGSIPDTPLILNIGGDFAIPTSLVFDRSGNLFVTDSGYPAIKKVANANFGSAPVGTASSALSLYFTFNTSVTLNVSTPYRAVTEGATGLDFSTADTGTCSAGLSLDVGWTCTVDVVFQPLSPGLRMGAVQLLDSGGQVIATGYVQGVGVAPQVVFPSGLITTVVGNGTGGYSGNGGPATSAKLSGPRSAAIDGAGNIYIADSYNHVIRKVDAVTGIITNFAGNSYQGYTGEGGQASAARLNFPNGVALDGAGNVYLADTLNHVIRRVDAKTGIITKWAGNGVAGYSGDNGPATSAQLNNPVAIIFDAAGNGYISDSDHHCIRKVDAATGIITTYAGTGSAGFSGDGGPAAAAALNLPVGLALDASRNLYITDNHNFRIRKVDATTGIISTIAGTHWAGYTGDGGDASGASFCFPEDVKLDPAGNIYIADTCNNVVRMISAQTNIITTVFGTGTAGWSGDGGPAATANLQFPFAIARYPNGNLLVVDYSNSRVRAIDLKDPPSLVLPSTTPGATSTPVYQAVANDGTASLAISSIVSSSANFTVGGGSATCDHANQTLSPGATCTIGVEFTPTATGTLTGTITLNDDALNAGASQQSMALSGVAPIAQSITFPNPGTKTYGDAPFTLSATASSGLSVAYSITSGPATVNGSTLTITGAGAVAVEASQPGDSTYAAASPVSVTFEVNKALPQISWTAPAAISYGTALGNAQLNASGSVPGTFAYTPDAGTVLSTGSHTLSATFSPTDSTNYSTASASVILTVNKAAPNVTTWPTASGITYGQTLASSTLSGGTGSVAGSFAFTAPSTSPSAGTAAQSVTFTPADTANYNTVAGTASVTVNKAAPNVMAWPTASSIAYGQTLASSTLSGGTASVAGAFAFTMPSTSPSAGTAAQSVTFTPADTANYNTVAGTASVTVNKAAPTVTTWPTASGITYGQTLASSTLSGGTGSVAGSFAFTAPSTSPSAGAALQSVTFTPADTANYNTVAGTASVTVNKATPNVMAWPTASSIAYGQTLASSTLSGGTPSVAGAFAFTAPSTSPSAGTAAQSVTFTPADTANYNTVAGTASVTVNKATPNVMAWPTASGITYGQTLASSTLSGGTASVAGSFAFTAPSTSPSAGTAAQSVTFTPSDTANYESVVGSTNVAVDKASSTLQWSTPAAITYGTALGSAQLNASSSVPGTLSYVPAAGTVLGAGVQTLTVTFTPSDATNYAAASASIELHVEKATCQITWNAPAAIRYGMALSETQLNATATVAGTFVYSPSAGAVLNAGTQSLTVSFTPTDTANYTTASARVDLSVTQATPQITWATPAAITYGAALSSAQLNASSNVDGSFVYSPAAGTVPDAGEQALTATFKPADTTNYTTVNASVALTVDKASPHISWGSPASITYGTALSGVQLNPTSDVPGTFTFSPDAGTVPGAGMQSITANFTPTDGRNYGTASASVLLSVSKTVPQVVLGSSDTSIFVSNAVTFTASAVVPGGTVGGTATFLDGQAPIGVSPVVHGTASLTTSSLAVGTHLISVTFSGDSNTQSAVSAPISEEVMDFVLSTDPGMTNAPVGPIPAGGSAVYTVSVLPINGGLNPKPFALSVSGVPDWASVTLSTDTLPSNCGTCQVQVNVSVHSEPVPISANQSSHGWFAGALLALIPFSRSWRRRARRLSSLAGLAILLIAGAAAASFLTACADHTVNRSFTYTITATSGTLSHSVTQTVGVKGRVAP